MIAKIFNFKKGEQGSKVKKLWIQVRGQKFGKESDTVPLIYNFTFTCVYTHGTTRYLAWKIPWFAMEIFFHKTSRGIFTTRVLAFPRRVTFPRDMVFHVTSHGIYTQRAWPWSSIVIWQQTHEKSYYDYTGSYMQFS